MQQMISISGLMTFGPKPPKEQWNQINLDFWYFLQSKDVNGVNDVDECKGKIWTQSDAKFEKFWKVTPKKYQKWQKTTLSDTLFEI